MIFCKFTLKPHSLLFLIFIGNLSLAQVTGFRFNPDSACINSSFGVTVTANNFTIFKSGGQSFPLFGFEPGTTTLFKIKTPTPTYLTNIAIQSSLVATGNVTVTSNTPPGTYDAIIYHDVEIPDAQLNNDYFGLGTYGEVFTWQCHNCFTVKAFPFYADSDRDGYGRGPIVYLCSVNASSPPLGYSLNNSDCDDGDSTVHPGATEICDQKDNDCDGLIDEDYSWVTGPFSSCSVECGNGVQTRTVTCKDVNGQVVPDSYCSCKLKPVDHQSCTGSQPPMIWYRDLDHDGFGNIRDTTFACIQPVGYVSNHSDCNDGDNTIYPGAIEVCDGKDNNCNGLTDEGDANFTWYTGTWGACSVTCGLGTQTRLVQCQNLNGQVVADCNCISPKPLVSQSCDAGPCHTYQWIAGDWGACSAPCGGGTQSRTVNCVDENGNIVAGSLCDPNTKPSISQLCNVDSCHTYHWLAGDWGSCSATCGGGTQSRTVSCLDENGNIVAGSLCDPNTKPATSQSCNTDPCPTYHWLAGDWGSCSATCGGGTQARTVSCLDENGNIVAGSLCDPNTKPATSQSCNTDPCPAYHWLAGNWGACSATCGGGTQSRTVSCLDENGNIVAGSLCDPNTKPASSQPCTGPQSAVSYYRDYDNDGYGNPNVSITACTPPAGYVSNNTDCNDSSAVFNPGASDANCNGIDEDCNGIPDDKYVASACSVCSRGVILSTVTNVSISGLKSLYISPTSVKLSWDLNPVFATYSVDYRISGAWTTVNNITAGMLTLTNLTANRIYDWRIRGVCANGNIGKYSNSTFNTIAPCANAPAELEVNNITANRAVLSWTAVNGAISYTIQSLNLNVWTTLSTVTTTSFTWSNLAGKTNYTWRVIANCQSTSSVPSIQNRFKTKNALVDLEERSLDSGISIFPNPSTSKVNIQVPGDETIQSLSLFDVNGKSLMERRNQLNELDLTRFASGLYMLKIKTDRSFKTVKIIKE